MSNTENIQEPIITIAWSARVRHIFVNGELLCKAKHRSINGYSHIGYVSYLISGLPDKPIKRPDTKYTHGDGIIPFKPLDKIVIDITEEEKAEIKKSGAWITDGLILTSICKQCRKKYSTLLKAFNHE